LGQKVPRSKPGWPLIYCGPRPISTQNESFGRLGYNEDTQFTKFRRKKGLTD